MQIVVRSGRTPSAVYGETSRSTLYHSTSAALPLVRRVQSDETELTSSVRFSSFAVNRALLSTGQWRSQEFATWGV